MADVTKLVIERDRWLRGEGHNDSRLLRADGKMCCLGFYGKTCGASDEDIINLSEPRELRKFPEWLAYELEDPGPACLGNTPDAYALMVLNDAEEITEETRESRITEIFAKHGVEVEFR